MSIVWLAKKGLPVVGAIAGLGALQEEAEAARVPGMAYVISRILAESGKRPGERVSTQEITDLYKAVRGITMETAPFDELVGVDPQVLRPLRRHGVLLHRGRGVYQYRGGELPKASAGEVYRILRRIKPDMTPEELVRYGYTPKEIEKVTKRPEETHDILPHTVLFNKFLERNVRPGEIISMYEFRNIFDKVIPPSLKETLKATAGHVVNQLEKLGVLEEVITPRREYGYLFVKAGIPKISLQKAMKVVEKQKRFYPHYPTVEDLTAYGFSKEEAKKAVEAFVAKQEAAARGIPEWLRGFGTRNVEIYLPRNLYEMVAPIRGRKVRYVARGGVPELSREAQYELAKGIYEDFKRKVGELGNVPFIDFTDWRDFPLDHPLLKLKGPDVFGVLSKVRNIIYDAMSNFSNYLERKTLRDIDAGRVEVPTWLRGFDNIRKWVSDYLRKTYSFPDTEPMNSVLDSASLAIAKGVETRRIRQNLLHPYVESEWLMRSPIRDDLLRLAREARLRGGQITLREMTTPELASLKSRHSEYLGKLASGKGVITRERLLEEAEKVPVGDFFLTETLKTYGTQSIAKVPHNIYQINTLMHKYPEREKIVEIYMNDMPLSLHPLRKDAVTVGWLRVDKQSTPGVWIIEEVQSDLLTALRARKGKEISDDTIKSLGKWAEYGLAQVLEDARNAGVKAVLLHTPESLKVRGGAAFGDRKLNELYVDLAKRFGFKVGRLKASDVQHLQREFEEVPIYLRIPSIIAVATAGAGALTLTAPDEAEAGIKGRIGKRALEKLAPRLSSTSSVLGGREMSVQVGKETVKKKIKEVRVGKEPWRYIVFEDGTYLPVQKKYLASWMRQVGTEEYVRKFRSSPPKKQWELAGSSLVRRFKQQEKMSAEEIEKLHQEWRRRVAKIQPGAEDPMIPVIVGTKRLYLPKSYADFLEKTKFPGFRKEVK